MKITCCLRDRVCTAMILVVLLLPFAHEDAYSQQKQAAPTTYQEFVFRVWKSVHTKILAMAKDFPEEKLGWRPHPDSRSMLEEFRHVTVGLEMSSATISGGKFDYSARVKADESKPKTRQSVVSEMEAAMAVSFPLVEKSSRPELVWWVEHQGEHYGKLVSNYRVNNIVPPASRKQQGQ